MHLLIIDDDLRQRELLQEIFTDQGHEVTVCVDGREALVQLDNDFDTVITDLKMPHVSGSDVLKACQEKDNELPVIIITGHGTIDSAIDAMKIGAYDYIQKPFEPEELILITTKALEHYRLVRTNREMAAALHTLRSKELIGSTPPMLEVKSMLERVAPLDISVLIQGETGTGKEVAARLIHEASKRAAGRFMAINCGALNETLLESELFGHDKGAFTGADREKHGLLETAAGGTLFLDEINSMSPALQVKLLRVLQENTFMRVGGRQEIKTDIRVISASNADLKGEVEKGGFRADLYYRLNVMTITMPPLRERVDDIPELGYYFLRKFTSQYDKPITAIENKALKLLMRYTWPGNVRELENCVSRGLIMEQGQTLSAQALPDELHSRSSATGTDIPFMPLAEIEAFMIQKALAKTQGNKSQAADLLGIDNSTLWRKMKRLQ
jgi:DNA-binding NtrC family response regulator